jgi:hypothetical protein
MQDIGIPSELHSDGAKDLEGNVITLDNQWDHHIHSYHGYKNVQYTVWRQAHQRICSECNCREYLFTTGPTWKQIFAAKGNCGSLNRWYACASIQIKLLQKRTINH